MSARPDIRSSDATASMLRELREEMNSHPLWNAKLLLHAERGHLTRRDFQFLFSQYHLYSANFTRYLGGLLATCDSDFYRAKLMQNLWEESGALDPAQRHSELFRHFLRAGLGVDIEAIEYTAGTRHFVETYLSYCQRTRPAVVAAFLAIGTEAIIPRLYAAFIQALRRVGIDDSALRFFEIHVQCDDEHAATLEELLASYASEPGFLEQARSGVRDALDARLRFFDDLYRELQQARVSGMLKAIDERRALCGDSPAAEQLLFGGTRRGVPLYANRMTERNIEFDVERVPFSGEVLDARLVRIPAGRRNELHKHAHESIFYVVRGAGTVHVNSAALPVQAGDTAFVPRWAMHQTENTGADELLMLAITDYNLTSQALIGNYNRTARYRQTGELLASFQG